MAVQWQQLTQSPRLLLEAKLQPIQGTRFQPTGFPDLGAAVYDKPGSNGSQVVLVESAQSVANRLEEVCWDHASDGLHPALEGTPYVSVELWDGKSTNSMLEAHRLNSPYIMQDDGFTGRLRAEADLPEKKEGTGVFDRRKLAKAAFKFDPGSVLHGVFLEKLAGVARLQRCLSGFIEAYDISRADSGGVKNDRVAPSPSALKEVGLSVSASDGYGNVPFHRTEYTARCIMAYFNLDLAQLRAYGLGERAEQFLVTLSLWKVRKFLETGLRLRTACDLALVGELTVMGPENGFGVPTTGELEAELPRLVAGCAAGALFADPPVTRLAFRGK